MLLSSHRPVVTLLTFPPPKPLWRDRSFSGALGEKSQRLKATDIINLKKHNYVFHLIFCRSFIYDFLSIDFFFSF